MPGHKRLYPSLCRPKTQRPTLPKPEWPWNHQRFLILAPSTVGAAPTVHSAISVTTTSLPGIQQPLMWWTSSPTAWTKSGIRRKWTSRSLDKHRRELQAIADRLSWIWLSQQIRPVECQAARASRFASTAETTKTESSGQFRRHDERGFWSTNKRQVRETDSRRNESASLENRRIRVRRGAPQPTLTKMKMCAGWRLFTIRRISLFHSILFLRLSQSWRYLHFLRLGRRADWSSRRHRWQMQRMHVQSCFRPLRLHMKSNHSKSRRNPIQ